jgi:hypothetical protein
MVMVLSRRNVSSAVTGAAIEHYGNARKLGRLPDENVGWRLLCDGPIRTERNLFPNSNTHNCPEGLSWNAVFGVQSLLAHHGVGVRDDGVHESVAKSDEFASPRR